MVHGKPLFQFKGFMRIFSLCPSILSFEELSSLFIRYTPRILVFSTKPRYNEYMEEQIITAAEFLKKRSAGHTDAYLEDYLSVVPAGQEYVPRYPATRVVHTHTTTVIHQHELSKNADGLVSVTRLFLDDSLLFKANEKEGGRHLPKPLKDALVVLMREPGITVPTDKLLKEANYKARNTFESNLRRLRVWGRTVGISESIVVGKSGSGYAISPNFSIQMVRSIPK